MVLLNLTIPPREVLRPFSGLEKNGADSITLTLASLHDTKTRGRTVNRADRPPHSVSS